MKLVNVNGVIKQQIIDIRCGGVKILLKKIKRVLTLILKLPVFFIALPLVIIIRLIAPWILFRFGCLSSDRIGHFAANNELYLCKLDAGINKPTQPYIDLFYAIRPVSNRQLLRMWRRVLHIWPEWILYPVIRVNSLIPKGEAHNVGNNTQNDRDVFNLLDKSAPHLKFSAEEELRGEVELAKMGIPIKNPFICLIVRDSAYLESHQPKDWSYHDYRDCDINNFILAAEKLAGKGYFVIRMGKKVNSMMSVDNPMIIDYAANGMQSDFMDVYLGAKCAFCVSTSTGFDAIPLIFRRPIVFVDMVPIGYLFTFCSKNIAILRHHYSNQLNRELTLSEIFDKGLGFALRTNDYESKGVKLIENSPEEICDVVIEMAENIENKWQSTSDIEDLQYKVYEIYHKNSCFPLIAAIVHGDIRIKFGSKYLRENKELMR